jgi:hypothetical protein
LISIVLVAGLSFENVISSQVCWSWKKNRDFGGCGADLFLEPCASRPKGRNAFKLSERIVRRSRVHDTMGRLNSGDFGGSRTNPRNLAAGMRQLDRRKWASEAERPIERIEQTEIERNPNHCDG